MRRYLLILSDFSILLKQQGLVSIWFSLNIHSPCSNKVDTDAKWFWLIRPYHKENLAYATSWVKSGQEPIMTM